MCTAADPATSGPPPRGPATAGCRRLIAALATTLLLCLSAGPVAAAPAEQDVTATGAVLWDPADGRVLFGKQARAALPMASTTKIMTVLLALEAGAAEQTLTVSARAAAVDDDAGAATLGLQPGQQLPLASVLEAVLLRSGNDAAVAIAEHVAGSEPTFVARMNARAVELGLNATNFVNASGLTNDLAHHASPTDLARLAEVAMRDDDFRDWAGSTSSTVPGIGTVVNRNELLVRYGGADGVKTGYTGLAGLCLVASATRDGRQLFSVVLDSQASFSDAAALLDYGFTAFRRVQPLRRGAPVTRYHWADAEVALIADGALGRTLPAAARARWRTVLQPAARRPLRRGQVLGRAELVTGGRVVDRVALRAARSVPASPPEASPVAGATTVGRAVQNAVRAFARLRPVTRDL